MIVIMVLCIGVVVYFLTEAILRRLLGIRNFEVRMLNDIEHMGSKKGRPVQGGQSSIYRFVLRLAKKIATRIQLKDSQMQWLQRDLQQQGIRMRSEEYVARMLLAVVGGALFGLYISFATGRSLTVCLLLGAYGGFTIFRFYTGKRKKERMQKIADQFPDMLDLLATSVAAGLGFTQAMQYVSEHYEGPLADEFQAVQRALALGSTRRTALMEMADRCGLQEMKTFVGAITQADELGISLGNILLSQSKEIRLLNRLQKEERAQKVAVKMLLPMVIFILPVLFIILMAPAAAQAVQSFGGGL